jgi:thymidylate synthase (FAD)
MKIVEQKVELLRHMGDDNAVCDAARVSFDKLASSYTQEQNEKLIKYLVKHGHWTPLAHTSLTFRIKAPIFVARQLGKHQVGLVWNEVSRRYVDSEPEYYYPLYWRAKAQNVKQGSSEEAVELPGPTYPSDVMEAAHQLYRVMLREGVCPEQARMILPQNMMTEWVWTGSLAAFARVCKLRLDPHSQKETQEIAQMISDNIPKEFATSWSALMEN